MRRAIWGLAASLAAAVLIYDISLAAEWWKERQLHLRAGFTARHYLDENGDKHGYVLFVPHDLPEGQQPAILLFLNGSGENGADGVRQINNNFGVSIWETRCNFPMLCLAPQCRKDWSIGSPDMLWANAILDQVIQEYDVD